MTVDAFATWLPVAPAGDEPVDVFDLLTAGGDELRTLWDMVWTADVDHRTLELCRTRIATMVAGTPTPSSDAVTDAQRAAVAFAEQFVLDPHGCTDEQMLGLQDHYTPEQLATLTIAIAVFDALARVHAVLAQPEEDVQ